jgi:membrane-associated phospholipid phosphatase
MLVKISGKTFPPFKSAPDFDRKKGIIMSSPCVAQFRALVFLIACLCLTFPVIATAQQSESPVASGSSDQVKTDEADQASESSPQLNKVRLPKPSPEQLFFKDLLEDQKNIWMSPLRIRRKQARWLVPLALTTTALMATDGRNYRGLGDSSTRLGVSRKVSWLGSSWGTLGVTGGFYLFGKLAKNDRAVETGLMSAEAWINTQLVIGGIKAITDRDRPPHRRGGGVFAENGGRSFPSGHSASGWALAAVVSAQYPDKPVIKYGALGLAAAVSVSRFTADRHYLSDVLVGGTIGWMIGKYVVRQRNARREDRMKTTFSPYLHSPSRSYGMGVTFSF